MTGALDHLASVEPLALRVAAAGERLRGRPAVAATQLEAILAGAREGDAGARTALLACCITLVQSDGEPWVLALRAEAERQSLPGVSALFGDAQPHRAVRRPGRLPDPCVSKQIATQLASISTKVRARSFWLPTDRILAHPDPEIVGRLLRAPSLRLRDALTVASRRPTSDAIVTEITRSLRWMGRIEVREALVANPFVRPAIALILLPTLLSPARRALGRGSVHPLVRRAASAWT